MFDLAGLLKSELQRIKLGIHFHENVRYRRLLISLWNNKLNVSKCP